MAINGLWKPSKMGGLLGWRHDPLLWTCSTPAIDVLQRCNLWREMDFLRRARIPSLSGSGLNPSWCFELLTSYWSHTSVACSKACCTVYCSYIAVVCMFDYSLFAIMLAQLENTKLEPQEYPHYISAFFIIHASNPTLLLSTAPGRIWG